MVFSEKSSSWFPGHMKFTKSLIRSYLAKVDLIVNVVDARAPFSTMNWSVFKLVKQKPFVVFFSKFDLADENLTKVWLDHFKNRFGFFACAINFKNLNQVRKNFDLAFDYLKAVKKLKFSSNMIRTMIIGISNVGKSTLINSFSGSNKVKVENRPGVTRSMQWIFLKSGFSLLDTPGVLPVEFENEKSMFILQLVGAIKREKVDVESLAINFLEYLKILNIGFFENNFTDDLAFCSNTFDWLNKFAKLKGMILKGNEPDLIRASNFLIDGFQSGKFGRLTLELPDV